MLLNLLRTITEFIVLVTSLTTEELINEQQMILIKYARQNDYQISPQHIYKDDGFSGSHLDRPALDRLRDTVAQGEVEAVLILSLDRLARQVTHQHIVVDELKQAGCEVVFTGHNFGASPAEQMLQEMTGVFAQYERAMITERCRRGRLHRARQGELWMKEGPYGYIYISRTENCPGKLVSNESEAEVVRMIFHLLIDEQLSTYQINERLYQSGIRTRHGNEPNAGVTARSSICWAIRSTLAPTITTSTSTSWPSAKTCQVAPSRENTNPVLWLALVSSELWEVINRSKSFVGVAFPQNAMGRLVPNPKFNKIRSR